MSPAASTRWCPTPEQLMILEEMYRGGVKTPNATQIQQITAHLSLYGKIEGKNVFYWFQNHKARDRQKLRRKLCRQQLQQQQQQQLLLHPTYHQQPSSISLHPFHHFNSLQWLPQEGVVQEESSTSTSTQLAIHHHSRKMHNEEMDNWMNMYGQDCMRMMMMDMHAGSALDPTTHPHPHPPFCSSRPLKTLELFPVNSNASPGDN